MWHSIKLNCPVVETLNGCKMVLLLLVCFEQGWSISGRSLVGGIGSSLGLASKAMKIKCETGQPTSRTTISARLNKLNSPLYSPLHIFVTQVQKVLGMDTLKYQEGKISNIRREKYQISGGKNISNLSALEPRGAHVTSDLTLPPIKVGMKYISISKTRFIYFL